MSLTESLVAPSPRVPQPGSAASRHEGVTTAGVLVFRLRGMRFALPSARVVEVMPVARERWEKLARMARTGTLGASGLPLIRLSSRLGLVEERAPDRAALVLFGEEGKVRATALLDDEPETARAEIAMMPADWRSRFEPCGDLIGGVARLPDGRQAAMLDMNIGIHPRKVAAAPVRADGTHLIVRRAGHEAEAVRLSSLQAIRRPGEIAGRSHLLRFGREATPLPVEAILGLVAEGQIEGEGSARQLVSAGRRYRLLDIGERPAPARGSARVLIAMPESPAREQARNAARALGHGVSLTDHPRALELAAGRFDVVLYDIDTYGLPDRPDMTGRDMAGLRVAVTGRGSCPEGFRSHVAADDLAGLLAAGLSWGAHAVS